MTCKKCGKPLPEGHKGKLCEGCMGKRAAGVKKAGQVVLGALAIVGGIALKAFTGKDSSNEV